MAFQNFFATRLATEIGTSDTTITLETAPTVTSGRLVLEARNPTQREIIEYTNVSGSDITGVTRGACGTTAKTHIQNSLVEMNAVGEDLQDLRDAFDTFVASEGDGWIDPADVPDTVTANGNRSYDLVFNSNDLTDTISPGMRLKLTRTVTAPTQCADLESGSSQYFNKTSPTGITFTDDFTVSAWIKLESYPAAGQIIISRYNGTSGWYFLVDAYGQVGLVGHNAGVGNYVFVEAVQSVPLNKWVHVAAQLDMSAFTATTTTNYVMIDGINAPVSLTRGGTNPTALVQAGNLEVGSCNSGTQPFDGKLAQVAVYSAKVTQATILASMHQTLSGSETSLASAYKLSNSVSDLSANANNLTAQNSALTTDTDSPFAGGNVLEFTDGTTEMAIVTKAAFSTNTTLTVQVPEGYAIPTSGGISAVRYSTHKVPYGFPASVDKWEVLYLLKVDSGQASPTNATWYNLGYNFTLPVGRWTVGYECPLYIYKTSATDIRGRTTLSTASNSETDSDFTAHEQIGGASGTLVLVSLMSRSKPISLSSATVYYLNAMSVVNSAGNLVIVGATAASCTVYARFGLL